MIDNSSKKLFESFIVGIQKHYTSKNFAALKIYTVFALETIALSIIKINPKSF